MGRTACTEPQCLYKGAVFLLSYLLWVVDRNVVTRLMTVLIPVLTSLSCPQCSRYSIYSSAHSNFATLSPTVRAVDGISSGRIWNRSQPISRELCCEEMRQPLGCLRMLWLLPCQHSPTNFRHSYRTLSYRRLGTDSNLIPLNAQLNPICPLLALLEAHHILHVSRIRVKQNILTRPACSSGQTDGAVYKLTLWGRNFFLNLSTPCI